MLFMSGRDRLVALAAHHGLPAIYQWCEFITFGGLMSYGTSQTGPYNQAGIMPAGFSRVKSLPIWR
jgi:putative ABC transport system substrate-binding protein